MTLYQIIKALQTASGSNAKQAILEQNKDNELLKAYLKATYDPSISFYQKAVPKHGAPSGRQAAFDMQDIQHAIGTFAERMVTGDAAKRAMQKWLEDQNSVEDQELCSLMIARSIGSGVGETMILKTFPGLFFTVPYMRCSLMTEKALAHFASLDYFIVEKKADSTFGYAVDGDNGFLCSRNGSHYPKWLCDHILEKTTDEDFVYVGELMVYQNGKELPRQTSNGIYNSILKGASREEYADYDFGMEAWDLLPLADFKAGFCATPCEDRSRQLYEMTLWTPNIAHIEGEVVKSITEARAVTSRHQLGGGEGSIWKDPQSPWKDGTSPYNIKDKIAFEAEYVVLEVFEGEKKYKGMAGGFIIASSEGKISNGVGTGMSDAQRKQFWLDREEMKGAIVTVIANDIIKPRNSDIYSLFLPVFSMVRLDKTEADSYDECLAILNAAKGLK